MSDHLYDPDVHHRRSIRFRGYDYSLSGAYFVTICTQHKECLFGEVLNGEMVPNSAGRMVEVVLNGLGERFRAVELDTYVVMPNHLHVVLVLHDGPPSQDGVGHAPTILRLGDIVGAFKSLSTTEYINGVNQLGWSPFSGKLWQRNYYERVIRNEGELNAIREYIANNPANWSQDEEHVSNTNQT